MKVMKNSFGRLHLFEFHDKYWCPQIFRNMMQEILLYLEKKWDSYELSYPLVKKVCQLVGTNQIIELCAGGFDGTLQKKLEELNFPNKLTLTDLFPNISAWKKIAHDNNNVHYIENSIDAINFSEELFGVKIIYTGFHHFKPSLARQFLQNIINKKDSICSFEMTVPSFMGIFGTLMSPLATLVWRPKCTRSSKKRFFWTYIVPVFLVLQLFDGLVSIMRTYRPKHAYKLINNLRNSNSYIWHVGFLSNSVIDKEESLIVPKKPINSSIIYLLGYPKTC